MTALLADPLTLAVLQFIISFLLLVIAIRQFRFARAKPFPPVNYKNYPTFQKKKELTCPCSPVPDGYCRYNRHVTRGALVCIFCGKPPKSHI